MTPYWTSADGRHTLYHGDCLAVLPALPKVDAVVTDPPYGIAHPCNYAGRGRGALAQCNNYPDVHGDNKPFDPAPFLALNVPTVLWGANWYADKLPPSGGWLVWDKERPDDLDQATCELAWTNCVSGVRRFRHLWNGMMKASEHGQSLHPMQKPAALYQWIFGLRWLAGLQVILDPYSGSGPVSIACIRTGRRSIMIEMEERYCEIAAKRMEAELAQPMLIPVAQEKPRQDNLFEVSQ